MLEWQIIFLEICSTVFFSLEYFLDKNKIRNLEYVFLRKVEMIGINTSNSATISRKKYRKNKKKNFIRLILSIFLFFVLLNTIFEHDFTNELIFPLLISSILCFLYMFVAIYGLVDHAVSIAAMLYILTLKKYFNSVKKGVLVAIGLFILSISFIGKILNAMEMKLVFFETVFYFLIVTAMIFIMIIIESYSETVISRMDILRDSVKDQ